MSPAGDSATSVPVETAPPDVARAPVNTRWRQLTSGNTFWIFLVLVAICAIFSVMRPHAFFTAFEARTVASNAAVLLVLAVGSTFVIITGGIDLSVGAVLVFSGIAAAEAMHAGSNASVHAGWATILWGLVAALGAGLGWGIVNGFLITKAKVPPLIVTLGVMGAALGFCYIITNGQDLRGIPQRLSTDIGYGRIIGIPWMIVIAAAVTALGAVVLTTTKFGRYTLAVGSNAEATRRAGINVDRHLIKVYALQGVLAGIAGFLALAFYNTTTISGHSSDNLNAIAAVVIGGTSLFGGRGTVVGTAIGVFIPAVLASGFVIVGVQSYWQDVAVGAVLIVAVYIDQLRRHSRERQ